MIEKNRRVVKLQKEKTQTQLIESVKDHFTSFNIGRQKSKNKIWAFVATYNLSLYANSNASSKSNNLRFGDAKKSYSSILINNVPTTKSFFSNEIVEDIQAIKSNRETPAIDTAFKLPELNKSAMNASMKKLNEKIHMVIIKPEPSELNKFAIKPLGILKKKTLVANLLPELSKPKAPLQLSFGECRMIDEVVDRTLKFYAKLPDLPPNSGDLTSKTLDFRPKNSDFSGYSRDVSKCKRPEIPKVLCLKSVMKMNKKMKPAFRGYENAQKLPKSWAII